MPKVTDFKPQAAAGGPDKNSVVVNPDSKPNTVDASLSGFAQFTIEIASDLVGGAELNGYDKKAHRYHENYIRPPFYIVTFDARLGLDLMRDIAVIQAPASGKNAGKLDSVEAFAAHTTMLLDHSGAGSTDIDDEFHSGGDTPIVPDNLNAYTWVVEDLDSDFVSSEIVQRPNASMYKVSFKLPRPGRYRVRCRAVFADGRMGEHVDTFEFRDWFIASVGDSFAAGQGNPDQIGNVDDHLGGPQFCKVTTVGLFLDKLLDGAKPPMAQDPDWMEPRAHRSMKSGPARAALALQDTLGQTWTIDQATRSPLSFDKIAFASFARTGARFDKGLLFAQSDPDIVGAGQIEELRRTAGSRRIDALMISIGGNDAGFAGVLADLLVEDSVFRASLFPFQAGDDAEARETIMNRLRAKLGVGIPPGQRGDLEILYDALRDQVDNLRESPGLGEVYISGYPTGMFTIRRADGSIGVKACGVFTGPDLDMSPPDMDMIHEHGRLLNALIERKAAEFGWHFVPVAEDFEGHGYCAPDGESYWVGAEESCRKQGDFLGMMHPNTLGHSVYGLRLMEAMKAHTFEH